MITNDYQLLFIVALILAMVATIGESVWDFIKLKRQYPIYFYDTHLGRNWAKYLAVATGGTIILFIGLYVAYRLYFNSH